MPLEMMGGSRTAPAGYGGLPPLLDELSAIMGQQGMNHWLTGGDPFAGGGDPYLAARAGLGRFALAPPVPTQEYVSPREVSASDVDETVRRIVGNGVSNARIPGSNGASPVAGDILLSPIENGFMDNAVGIEGNYGPTALARLNDPQRLAKQKAHHDKVRGMQPQYAPMEARQAAVAANARNRGTAREARMGGGYGPMMMNRMVGEMDSMAQGGQPQGSMAGNPLLAGLMFGPQAFGAAMNSNADLAQVAARMQLGQNQINAENARHDAEMGIKNREMDLMSDPMAAARAGKIPLDQAAVMSGDRNALMRQIAASAGNDYDKFSIMVRGRMPDATDQEIEAAWRGYTGTEPIRTGSMWSNWFGGPSAPGIAGAMRDVQGASALGM